MSDLVELQEFAGALTKPYVVTRSKLGSTTKLIDEKFICSARELEILYDSLGEKISSFQPSKAGFQYLISFTDSTHYENHKLTSLDTTIANSSKKTEKLILNWAIGHEYDGIENEMTITVRISNPMNPIVMLQAMMSADHSDADRLDFEDGCVSVSINGATQITAEEIFAIVQRWAEACPQPQSITNINKFLYKHSEKVSFLNYWIFPILFTACSFQFLQTIALDTVVPYVFLAIVAVTFLRSAAQSTNRMIERWAHTSRNFSLFMVTGGDNNQQTKVAAKSKNSTIKLVSSVAVSFVVNIAAGLMLAWLVSS